MARSALAILVFAILASCTDATAPALETSEAVSRTMVDTGPQRAVDAATLCCADQWTTRGIFTSMTLQSPTSTVTGLNTSSVTWGRGNPSGIDVESVTSAGEADGSYPSSGALLEATFHNGGIFAGSGADGGVITVDLEGCSVDGSGACVPDGSVQVLEIPFEAVNTPNTGDPIASADQLYLPDLDVSLNVIEGASEAFVIYYQRRSPLRLVDVAVVGGSGFVSVGRSSVPVVEPRVDIHPGSEENPVNVRSRGRIPVALLGSDVLDVSTVDAASLTFGPAGAAPTSVGREDVDGDGRIDLVVHVPTQDTGIVCGDTFASLKGRLLDGRHLAGRDALRTEGCKG